MSSDSNRTFLLLLLQDQSAVLSGLVISSTVSTIRKLTPTLSEHFF
jgi:hypothetical protein